MSMQEFSEQEIHNRIVLGEMLVRELKRDPTADEAIGKLRGQMTELREELARRANTPPPVVIGLQTADLDAVMSKE